MKGKENRFPKFIARGAELTQLAELFAKTLPAKSIVTDLDIISPYLREWRDRYFGTSPLMLVPENSDQVQEILRIANENSIKIVTQGGNTGLVGAQIPMGEVLLSTKKLNKILEIRSEDDCIIVESGATLDEVAAAAEGAGRIFPLKLASSSSATIGGLISTNAGGVHVRKYGMTRSLILGLEAILPNGEKYCDLNPLRKDNTGYDLKQFFIGAEGTLGIVTKACLKLIARPKSQVVAMIGLSKIENSIVTLHQIEDECDFLTAFEIINEASLKIGLKNLPNAKNPFAEFYPYIALVEFSSQEIDISARIESILGGLLEKGIITDCVVAQSSAQADNFWNLREGMSAAQKPEGRAAKHDISVPISKIPQFFENAAIAADKVCKQVRIHAFGHVSDGNIHYDVARPIEMADIDFQDFVPKINAAVNDIALSLGGSISAEHGIGIARKAEFIANEPIDHLKIMKAIKRALDPNNILNPRLSL